MMDGILTTDIAQVWQRIHDSIGQYRKYSDGFYIGGVGCLVNQKFYVERGVYKLEFISKDPKAFVTIRGHINIVMIYGM